MYQIKLKCTFTSSEHFFHLPASYPPSGGAFYAVDKKKNWTEKINKHIAGNDSGINIAEMQQKSSVPHLQVKTLDYLPFKMPNTRN